MLLISWIFGLKQRFRLQWICFVCHQLRWLLTLLFFDSWYMAKEILDFISSRGLTWVSKARNNRLILIDETWVSLKWYAKHLSKKRFTRIDKIVDEKRYKWFFEATVTMKNVGEVQLVVLRMRKNSRSFSFLASNNTKLNGLQVLRYYKNVGVLKYFIGIANSIWELASIKQENLTL